MSLRTTTEVVRLSPHPERHRDRSHGRSRERSHSRSRERPHSRSRERPHSRLSDNGPMKRLIATCDGEFENPVVLLVIVCAQRNCTGTWLDSDNGMLNGKRQVESNVTRISRAIKPESKDGIQQIVYYGKGIASQGGVIDRSVMGKFLYLSYICRRVQSQDSIRFFQVKYI